MRLSIFLLVLVSLEVSFAEVVSFEYINELIDSLDLNRAESLIKSLDADEESISYLRGKLSFFKGEYAEAVRYFSTIRNEDYIIKCARNAYEITKDYKRYDSEHFIFLYPTEREEIFIEYLVDGLERSLKDLAPTFGFRFKEKIRVEILDNQLNLSRLTNLSEEAINKTNTIAITKFNKIMLSSPETQLEGYDYVNTAIHEFIHYMISTVTHERTPVWIHEALARYFDHYEKEKLPDIRPDTLSLLKMRYVKKNLITFEQIHPSMALLPSQEDTTVAFAEVFLVSEFLYKREGLGFVNKLLGMLRDRKEIDEIFTGFGFSGFKGFEKEFFSYLERRLEKVPSLEHLYYERRSKKGNRSEYMGDALSSKYVRLGDLLFLDKLYSAAFVEYDKASKIGVINPHIENRKAFALISAGRFKGATDILERIVDIYPDYYSTFVNLARGYMAQKDYAKAISALERAVRINPFDKEIYYYYEKIFSEQKNQYELTKVRKKLEILNR